MSESPLVQIEFRADLVELVLVRGRGNALIPEVLDQLEAAFHESSDAGALPVVLRAAGPSFCTGLDLDVALSFDREQMRGFMERFHRALFACAGYPGPVVAAIGGHALAGGALLALACDLRIMARGPARFGVHGVQLGVSYPDVAIEIVRHQLGVRRAERLLHEGRLHAAEEACAAGWVDMVVSPAELLATARAQAARRAHPSRDLAGRSKRRLRRPLLDALAREGTAGMDAWLDQWFSESTQTRLATRTRTRARPPHDASGPTEVNDDPDA